MHSHEYTDQLILEKLELIAAGVIQARDPIDFPIQISTTMPWMVDYHQRRHIFIWSPVSIILNLEDYGPLQIVAGNWQQLDMPAGMRITANNTSPIYIYGKATDDYEVDEAGIISAVNDIYTYTHIAANGTFNINTKAGHLHTITINNPGASWTLTVYDNTSASAPIVAVVSPVAGLIITLEYDIVLNTGLTIVAAGTTPGDVTVASR